LADSLKAFGSVISAYHSQLTAFTPTNAIEEAQASMLESFYEILNQQNNAISGISDLQTDTVADADQQIQIDSLYLLATQIPEDVISDLYSMALECPYEKGEAVLWARAAFPDSVFSNACEASLSDSSSARYGYVETPSEKTAKKQTQQVKVYPNPAIHQFIIELPEGVTEATFQLVDVLGRKLFVTSLKQSIQQVSPSQLSSGMYFYKVLTGDDVLGEGKLFWSTH